jgi:hypothetical protein
VVRTATRQPQCGHGRTAVTPAAVASARYWTGARLPADDTDTIGNEPAAPPPHTIQQLGTYLHDILDADTPAERKAAVEALIAEIRITEEGIIPVFRIPGPGSPHPRRNQHNQRQRGPGSRNGSIGRVGRWAERTSVRTAMS